MWKFQDFSATQILREINFLSCSSSKMAIFAVFELLNFEFGKFQTSEIAKKIINSKFRASKNAKMAVF